MHTLRLAVALGVGAAITSVHRRPNWEDTGTTAVPSSSPAIRKLAWGIEAFMEQRCHLWAIWLTWLGLPVLALATGWRLGWTAGLVILVVGVVGQVLYIRWFPRISRALGYGSVADAPADPALVPDRLPRVTLYTANVCPFCPIVKRRLAELQRRSPFELQEIDVTFRPELIRAKGLRSVPVIETNGRVLVGNVTSAELVRFLREAAGAHESAQG